MTDRIDDGVGTYDVVLLIEHELSRHDAEQVASLHDEIADQVVYHVVVPLDDAASRIESSMTSLSGGEVLGAPMPVSDELMETVRREALEEADEELGETVAHLAATGAQVRATLTSEHPVDAVAATVADVDAREVIVLTSPHVVAEFFHVDWSSQARRKLGVPVLHLLEHESFDEQAGGGEGVIGV